MKKARLFISLVLVLIVTNFVLAQEVQQYSTTVNNKGLYIGGQASTGGWGADVRYVFNKTITLKGGIETLNLDYEFNFNESDIEYDATLDYTTGGFFLMADFNYTKNLYISVGASLNSLNPRIQGKAVSDLKYGDIIIPASEVGDFIFDLTPSMEISPYAGVGFRGFFGTKERVCIFIETGFYYLGAPNVEIEATGLLTPTADPAHGQKEVFENQFSQYKFYPVIKLNLAVKLF
ncbi:MAG: hypothetical protein HQ522_20765 [Bacteroidetes bacterium]|nr:hypothetical protein [Bacteroidota bacterium]